MRRENAWPWPDSYPAQLARTLDRSPEWRLVLSQDSSAVFVRTTVSDRPEVEPSARLAKALGRRSPR